MKKYLAALLVALGMLLVMAAPALAQDGCVEEFPGAGSGACEQQPGKTERSRAAHETPPHTEPGAISRDAEANEHDEGSTTGRGDRIVVPTTTE
jgi:hypothetical protein